MIAGASDSEVSFPEVSEAVSDPRDVGVWFGSDLVDTPMCLGTGMLSFSSVENVHCRSAEIILLPRTKLEACFEIKHARLPNTESAAVKVCCIPGCV